MSVGKDLLNVPFPQMVQSMGMGVAEAQFALDRMSVEIAQKMAGLSVDKDGNVKKDETLLFKQEGGGKLSLLELGFKPSFFSFKETWIELKMAISMKDEIAVGVSVSASYKAPFGVFSASVNASYSQKYQYSADGSSYLKTKLVATEAPDVFLEKLKKIE